MIRPFYRLARQREVKRQQSCLSAFARQHVRPHALSLPVVASERQRAQLSSFTGHLLHANSPRLWQRIRADHPWLAKVFVTGATPAIGAPRWNPAAVSNLADQHKHFARRLPGVRVQLQVGKHWPLAGPCPAGLPQGHRVVNQTGHFKTGFKQRSLTAVWMASPSEHFLLYPTSAPQLCQENLP